MPGWNWRVFSASLLTTLGAGLLMLRSERVETATAKPWWLAGAAAVAVGGPFWVDWVHKRVVAKELATAVAELLPADSPAGLLRADRHIVPFTGRANEFDKLRDWCRDRKPGVRLLVGPGGVGKTRLALHLGEYLRSAGWSVTVVGAGREAEAFTILRDATRRSSIFLIVDYAETRTGLVDLLRSVAASAAHVRVLLIARRAGDWWLQLRSDVPAVQDLVDPDPPMELPARVDSAVSPTELIRIAVRSFAEELGVPVPTGIVATPPADEVPVLALQAAALLAVLQSRERRAPVEPLLADIGVLAELLRHERRFWVHSAEQAGLGLDLVVLQRAVAVACLFGARSESDGAEVLRRVPDLRDDESRRRRVARWLAQLYPSGAAGYWGLLQPELVAETHVIEQLTECPELVMADLSELRDEQARQMLRVLSMGTAHQPVGVEQLENVLRADIERLVYPALEVAKVTGGALGAALARVLSDAPVTLETLRTIEEAIPYPTTALAETAVVVTSRILDMLSPDAPDAERARWYLQLGVVLAQAGRADEALRPIEIAVEYYRTLAGTDRLRYLPDLARVLHRLGNRYAEQGRHVDALPDTEQAIEYYRELVAHNPDDYRADLAGSLSTLGLCLDELGRHTEARAPLNEAVQCYWELVETDDRYRRNLVRASLNLRRSESRVPLDIGILETAVEHNRTLVETDRDSHLPELARSLCDLGKGYAEQDGHEQGRPAPRKRSTITAP
jgi:tetratricopeptide (TPR) repeat protein